MTNEVRGAWLGQFVEEREPFFLPDDLLPLLPPESPLLARTNTAALVLSRSALDTYGTFRIDQQARWLTVLTPAAFAGLLREAQERLLVAQWSLGRGQLYQWDVLLLYAPRQLANLAAIIGTWAEDGYHPRMYRRC